ncbi:MAG: cupin domain-containing protein [Vicinamibacterales bacterium]|jgi:quercetin dioxygenase-like cupin family protein|nr:cupin domain-containing protein [Vicinamibacterales bacterium]
MVFVKSTDSPAEQTGPGVTRQVLGYDRQLMMVRFTFDQGAVGALHHHPHRQVSYVEAGSFEVTIAGEKTVLQRGDCYFVPPDAVHGVVALEPGSLVDVFAPMRDDFVKV